MGERRARLLGAPRALVRAALLLALGCGALVVGVVARADTSHDFVTRDGRGLAVAGEPFRFVGFNLYDAAASDIYSCHPSTRLDDAGLASAMQEVRDAGGTVVRFWAYQTYTAGGTDFSGTDRVIDAARDHGLRVVPVLEDGPGNCSTGPPAEPLGRVGGWYVDGYREPWGTATVSYRDYVRLITQHYRDEPAIVAWSLFNEAETTERDDRGHSVLVDFARDVAGVVHRADPHHLVTLGTQGNGAPGASGGDLAAIYSLDEMDFVEVHDWAFWGSDHEALPGASPAGSLPSGDACMALDAQIACAFRIADELGKPIVVGEAGMSAKSSDNRDRRADLFVAKLSAAFEAGASGYLVWQLNRENTDTYGVRIGSGDPLFGVLRDAADRWATAP